MNKSNGLIMAVILLIGGLSSFVYWQRQKVSYQAQQHWKENLQALFSQYTNRGSVRVETADREKEILIETESLFKESKYLAAIALLEQFLKGDPGNEYVLLRLGVLYALEKQIASAQAYLKAVYTNPLTALNSQAHWLAALLAIQNNNRQEAQKILMKLVSTNSHYKPSAKELLKKLRTE